MRASVNIYFLGSFFFLHSVGSVPWLRTTAPSLHFLRLSPPFFCFQAQIQLDCGEDNICVPDLKLAVYGWAGVIFLWLYSMKMLETVESGFVLVLCWSHDIRQISTFHSNESRYVWGHFDAWCLWRFFNLPAVPQLHEGFSSKHCCFLLAKLTPHFSINFRPKSYLRV